MQPLATPRAATATRRNTNPFDDAHTISGINKIRAEEADNHSVGGTGDRAQSSTSLFPDWLSTWMSPPPRSPSDDGDDDSLQRYHDCLSNVNDASSSSIDDESTSLLAKTAQHDGLSPRPLSPLRQRARVPNYNATTSASANTERRRNGGTRSSSEADIHVDTGLGQENNHYNLASPFADALTTWLSPYADSARRAGRKLFHFSDSSISEGTDGGDERRSLIRFHPDFRDMANGGDGGSSLLSRVSSSPALLKGFADVPGALKRAESETEYSTIVLKDIVVEGEDSNADDGTVIHPWTKLILLEELGTAWSWFVLLVPYFFMLLAIILDGDTALKNTVVGPLNGTRTCAELVQGSVPTPFDASVKGFYPVPFRLATGNVTGQAATLSGSCTYPFELREGVGLLSHDRADGSNATLMSSSSPSVSGTTSIIDSRYRYIMSHGHAWTSGVIPDVPPTAQSLRGSVSFHNLSSAAVSLVARGSVLVSVVVFQRQLPSLPRESATNSTVIGQGVAGATQQWSPVLILSSKKLDMVCQLNREHNHGDEEASTWNCSSHRIVDAFFSLPNAAVLVGGDLRVDVLLSHHKTYKSLSGDLWFNERDGIDADDDYVIADTNETFHLSKAEKILSKADVSSPQQLLAELSTASVYKLQHESTAFNTMVEGIRIVALAGTLSFLVYWLWCMAAVNEDSSFGNGNSGTLATVAHAVARIFCCTSGRRDRDQLYFWWEDPWSCFPERRYLLLLICCLLMLQNPLFICAFFRTSLYGSSWFRFLADSMSGISVHGILFLWLCLVHGLRYHTADIARRRLDQHRRVLELSKSTRHIAPSPSGFDDSRWGRVKWYYSQYGDVDGGYSLALRMKHDVQSDSFVDYMFPKMTLLALGVVASVTVAATRFPMEKSSIAERAELNPDRFGRGSTVYVIGSFAQLLIVQIWCLFIVYTSFVTGGRLKREPFLSTRPAQLAFRVLSSILLLGAGFSIALFCVQVTYDTSGGGGEAWDSKADILFDFIRRTSMVIPYVGSASTIGPGKILYATACSLVVAYIFLPSSHFQPSKREQQAAEEIAFGHPDQYSRQNKLSDMDKRMQGKDKRFVVALARNTHTWRVFPLPMRSHGLMSQHTLKEQLNIIGTFQLTGQFTNHSFKFGRGAIYKGNYTPVFCVEIACWLLEASWQAYYSPTEYSTSDWAPGLMRLDSIGLKLEHQIHDSETDTHGFVASNISEQVEGEDDSIIVIAFRGTNSRSNIKTDLSFRQVPLPEKMISDVPAFNIRPGLPVAVDETLWKRNGDSSSPSVLQEILRQQPSGKYSSWPTARGNANVEHVEPEHSNVIPNVSIGAKAIIRATPMARQALPCVHEGFLQVYSKVRREIVETVMFILKRQLDRAVERSQRRTGGASGDNTQPLSLPKIYITGHSLGGAIGQLLALDLASNCEIVVEQPLSSVSNNPSRQSLSSLDEEVAAQSLDTGDVFWLGQKLTHPKTPTKTIRVRPAIAVYTYGQPRVGNLAFKTIYKKRVPHTFRLATEGDAFTTMPTTGPNPICGGIYRHAGLEVLLEEGCTGNILVGPTVVETLLRFTKVRTSWAAHMMEQYRESLESALGKEELKEYYRGHGGKVRHGRGLAGSGAALPSWVTSVKRSHDV
ncbi:hypothetical protein ACHAXT_002570 [Thalassiosira profunda]